MNKINKFTLLTSMSVIAASSMQSSAIVLVLSDLTPAGSPLETFFLNNFSNVTEVRHANYADFNAAASQDALNGTGAFAGNGAADIFIIGRSLGSADYQNGAADGYNGIAIPFVNLTGFTARQNGNRLGWHGSGTINNQSRNGAETTVTAFGATALGIAAGIHDLHSGTNGFNALSEGMAAFGDGQILATIGNSTLAAFWDTGDAPGNAMAAGLTTFPAPRLLFNLDNEANNANDGANDLNNLTPAGLAAFESALVFATPLTSIPEPSTGLLAVISLGLLIRRRR